MTSSFVKSKPVFDATKADQLWSDLQHSHNGGNLVAPDHFQSCALLAGHSPYLAGLMKRHSDFTVELLLNPTRAFAEIQYKAITEPLRLPRPPSESKDSLMAALRSAKDRVALLTAFMDINGLWALADVTWHLTDFAGAALDLSIAHAFHAAMTRGELPWPRLKDARSSDSNTPPPVSPDLIRNSGYFALAMGKMGGFELNYSSDIDLIIFYDPSKITYTGRKDIKDCMVKITQMMVELMDRRTMYGYVFRVDLRLRPDPGSTPVAISFNAALAYYHAHALNWERSAMIKARPAAGDLDAGADFLAQLNPWIWRRSMDFEAMGDIIAMKEQINRHYDQWDITLAGYNVKLGHGGIREIEFYTQINQLLLGGRHPEFRSKATLESLEMLANKGRIKGSDCSALIKAYDFLRRVEHFIQMTRDEQNHQVPESEEDIARLTSFLGYDTSDAFQTDLFNHCNKVAAIYDSLLPNKGDSDGDSTVLPLSDQALTDLLAAHGYDPVAGSQDIVKKWITGKYKAVTTDRAKRLVKSFLPDLIVEFGKSSNPALTLTRFDKFLAKLPAGVQLFSLLQANPSLFRLLGRIMGLAPALSDILAKHTSLWDALLEPDFFAPIGDKTTLVKGLERELSQAKDYQDVLDIVRRWTHEKKFQVAVQALEGVADIHETGPALTLITDVCIRALIPRVEAEFAEKHGHFPEPNGLGVLAMGKYGGRELTFTSDLDLVFLYSVADMDSQSDGPRPLSPSSYFSRLGQHVITAMTALTSEGQLFEVDTRLRPSGSQGPLVVTLKTFADYYSKAAWTWEHMALTRARLIYAPKAMEKPLLDTIFNTLAIHRDEKTLKQAVQKMRSRLFHQFGSEINWNIKHTRGGLVDMEFIIQYLLLKHGNSDPTIFMPEVEKAIIALKDAAIISETAAKTLTHSHWLQQTIQSTLRIAMINHPQKATEIPSGLQEILIHLLKVESFNQVETMLDNAQKDLHALYIDLIGDYLSKNQLEE